MPQMAPMNWVALFIYFSWIYLMMNSMTYFIFLYKQKDKSKKKIKLTLNWKW